MTCHASCAECQDPLPLLYRPERRCGPFHQRDEGWKLSGLGIERVEKGEHLGLKSKECVAGEGGKERRITPTPAQSCHQAPQR